MVLQQDQHGFILTNHCDSTLFSGLLGASGYDVDLLAAEKSPGEWYRRPTTYPECWGCGKSRSTISRDMLLGVYWWAWTHRDLAMLERLWDYGTSHFWRMGRGRFYGADTVMNTAMISTLAQLIFRLGGKNHWFARRLPTMWGVKDMPFKNRLTALHLGLRREAWGKLGWDAQFTLDKLAQNHPDNPLMLWAAGYGYDRALANSENTVPSGTHSDEEWPIERAFVKHRS